MFDAVGGLSVPLLATSEVYFIASVAVVPTAPAWVLLSSPSPSGAGYSGAWRLRHSGIGEDFTKRRKIFPT
ncbi:MAG: hypothetical protein QNI91_18560 [Arenicellales bacterium]|nr:hypothetical protein [Arenicellales bacterium]